MVAADCPGRRRIAVIEDDDDVRLVLQQILSDDGYDVRAFHDAGDALRVLRAGPAPDLILLDLRMPGMDGWQFRVEQKRDRVLASVPVVALSADGTSQARAIDVEAFIEKPPKMSVLLASVRRIIDAHEEERTRTRQLVLERIASLGARAAAMAHEIDDPLAIVLANLHLVRNELDNNLSSSTARNATVLELDGMLRDALEGALRIENIVRDLHTVWNAPAEGSARTSSTPPRLPSLRVLIVDDEPAIGRALARILRNDHEVTIMDGGAKGVECALQKSFDIVLCDLLMHDVSGIDVFERLRAERAGLERRIVFMVGGGFTEVHRAFVATVENAVLEKPIDRVALYGALGDTVARAGDALPRMSDGSGPAL